MDTATLDDYARHAVDAAREAGAILRERFRRLPRLTCSSCLCQCQWLVPVQCMGPPIGGNEATCANLGQRLPSQSIEGKTDALQIDEI